MTVVIIAGPNGAGKTTFAQEFLPNEANCPVFVNAGHIAAGVSPSPPPRDRGVPGRPTAAQGDPPPLGRGSRHRLRDHPGRAHLRGDPNPLVHCFPQGPTGKAIPYSIYDMERNEAWVNVGRHDTPAFAVASLRL